LRAFRLPFGAPGEGPPCIPHLPFAIAGDWQDFPFLVHPAMPGRADLAILDRAAVRDAHLFANEKLALILSFPHEDFGC